MNNRVGGTTRTSLAAPYPIYFQNMKFLVAILTSSRPQLARHCHDSILGQQHHDFQYDIVMVINSVNPGHKADIERVMQGTSAYIIETHSNGRPGMGHNSLLEIFQESLNYDYLIPIDGDDILYPSAFHQLQKSLKFEPQLLCIQTNDSLTRDQKLVRHAPLANDWRLVSWFDDQENWWKIHQLRNPFSESIRDCATPSRPVLIHRSAIGYLPRRPYGEDLALYDDMIFFLHLCEAFYRRPEELRLYFTSNTYIYIHNDMNPASATNAGIDYAREQELFNSRLGSGYYNIKRWQLDELPHCQISNPDWFSIQEKIAFATLATQKIDQVPT